MIIIHNATIMVNGLPLHGLALNGEIGDGRPLAEEDGPMLPDTGGYECSFTCNVDGSGEAVRVLKAIAPRPISVMVTASVSSRPVRQPYRVTSRKSRSGVWHYGCSKLGQSYWKPCQTSLERRKMRSRIEAFNRIHPSPMGKRHHVESIVGDIVDIEVTSEADGTARATMTLVERTAPVPVQPFFPAIEGVSNR